MCFDTRNTCPPAASQLPGFPAFNKPKSSRSYPEYMYKIYSNSEVFFPQKWFEVLQGCICLTHKGILGTSRQSELGGHKQEVLPHHPCASPVCWAGSHAPDWSLLLAWAAAPHGGGDHIPSSNGRTSGLLSPNSPLLCLPTGWWAPVWLEKAQTGGRSFLGVWSGPIAGVTGSCWSPDCAMQFPAWNKSGLCWARVFPQQLPTSLCRSRAL